MSVTPPGDNLATGVGGTLGATESTGQNFTNPWAYSATPWMNAPRLKSPPAHMHDWESTNSSQAPSPLCVPTWGSHAGR